MVALLSVLAGPSGLDAAQRDLGGGLPHLNYWFRLRLHVIRFFLISYVPFCVCRCIFVSWLRVCCFVWFAVWWLLGKGCLAFKPMPGGLCCIRGGGCGWLVRVAQVSVFLWVVSRVWFVGMAVRMQRLRQSREYDL